MIGQFSCIILWMSRVHASVWKQSFQFISLSYLKCLEINPKLIFSKLSMRDSNPAAICVVLYSVGRRIGTCQTA
jgi:hypothetical protein